MTEKDRELAQALNRLEISPSALIDPRTGDVYTVGEDIPGDGSGGTALTVEDNGVEIDTDVSVLNAGTAFDADSVGPGEISFDIPGAPGASVGDVFTKVGSSTFDWEPPASTEGEPTVWDTASKSTDQAFSTADAWFTVEWDSEEASELGGMNAAGDEWVAPETGWYLFMARFMADAGSSAEVMGRIRNTTAGTTVALSENGAGSNVVQSVEVWGYASVTAGDSVSVEMQSDLTGGGSVVVGGEGSAEFSVTRFGDGGSTSGGGLTTVSPSDLDAIDSPGDGEIPKYDSASGSFEWLPDLDTSSGDGTGDAYAVVSPGSVSDIASAVASNQVVIVQPGSYTHDGSTSITHSTGSGHTVVFAYGAEIEVNGGAGTGAPVVDVSLDTFKTDSFAWYGGTFEGHQAQEDVAFDIADCSFGVFKPRNIYDCEVGMVLRNESSWCEFVDIDFRGRHNRVTLAVLGVDSTGMTGRSISTPDNGGTQSFRDLNLNIVGTPLGESGGVTCVVYTDEAKVYASKMKIEANRDDNVQGLRLHKNFPGTAVQIHTETPGSRVNGTGVVVDEMVRPPMQFLHSSSTAGGGTQVENNTTEPWFERGHPRDSTPEFGETERADGSTIAAYRTDIPGPDGFGKRLEYPIEFLNAGTSSEPAVRLGTNGAGLYASGGEVFVVNSSGGTTQLT